MYGLEQNSCYLILMHTDTIHLVCVWEVYNIRGEQISVLPSPLHHSTISMPSLHSHCPSLDPPPSLTSLLLLPDIAFVTGIPNNFSLHGFILSSFLLVCFSNVSLSSRVTSFHHCYSSLVTFTCLYFLYQSLMCFFLTNILHPCHTHLLLSFYASDYCRYFSRLQLRKKKSALSEWKWAICVNFMN